MEERGRARDNLVAQSVKSPLSKISHPLAVATDRLYNPPPDLFQWNVFWVVHGGSGAVRCFAFGRRFGDPDRKESLLLLVYSVKLSIEYACNLLGLFVLFLPPRSGGGIEG